jgi:hypothetical protein
MKISASPKMCVAYLKKGIAVSKCDNKCGWGGKKNEIEFEEHRI